MSMMWSLVQQNSLVIDAEDIYSDFNQGTKFETLEKPMFSFFDVTIFLLNGKIEQSI